MEQETTGGERPTRGGWLSVAGLFAVVLATSAFVHAAVVIGVPLLLLLAARGFGNVATAAVSGFVILIVIGGSYGLWDGLWYAERAWAVLLGGWFLALQLLVPGWRLTSRALAAAAGSAAVCAGVMAMRTGAWSALDGAVTQTVQADLEATLAAVSVLGGSNALSPEMLSVVREVSAAQIALFPALLGIESLAALGLAWWLRWRLLGEGGQGLAPLRDFRFNDHLVWVLVGGLLLVTLQSGAALARVGSNAVVFMGALYALRGAGVYLFITGGMSVFGYVVLAVLLVLVPPAILGTAALIGIGDTWLDLRTRAASRAA